jgi:hypothetical protein
LIEIKNKGRSKNKGKSENKGSLIKGEISKKGISKWGISKEGNLKEGNLKEGESQRGGISKEKNLIFDNIFGIQFWEMSFEASKKKMKTVKFR